MLNISSIGSCLKMVAIDNAASVCSEHHLDCEYTKITVQQVYDACSITTHVLPDGFSPDKIYDKWGNEIINEYKRIPGPLFNDTAVQKIFKEQGTIWIFYV